MQLVVALDDLEDLGVAQVPGDRVLVGDAVGAVDLEGVGGGLQGDVGRGHLRHRRGVARPEPVILEVGQPVGEQPRALGAADHVAQHLLHHLELADRLLEDTALPCVVGRDVNAGLREPDRARGNAEAAVLDGVHRDLEPLPLLAHERVLWHAHVLEHELAGRERPKAVLVLERMRAHALRVGVDDEGADALSPRLLVHPEVREREVVARDVEEADPHLRAAEHVVVAVPPARRVHVRHIRAGAGLGHAGAGEHLPLRERDEVALLLLLGAVAEDRVPDEAARERQRARDHVAVARDLLHQRRVRDVVEAGAAVLGGDDPAGEAELAGLLDDLLRETLLAVVVGDAGRHLALRPVARQVDQ